MRGLSGVCPGYKKCDIEEIIKEPETVNGGFKEK